MSSPVCAQLGEGRAFFGSEEVVDEHRELATVLGECSLREVDDLGRACFGGWGRKELVDGVSDVA